MKGMAGEEEKEEEEKRKQQILLDRNRVPSALRSQITFPPQAQAESLYLEV